MDGFQQTIRAVVKSVAFVTEINKIQTQLNLQDELDKQNVALFGLQSTN